jgi:hypothetical protein
MSRLTREIFISNKDDQPSEANRNVLQVGGGGGAISLEARRPGGLSRSSRYEERWAEEAEGKSGRIVVG